MFLNKIWNKFLNISDPSDENNIFYRSSVKTINDDFYYGENNSINCIEQGYKKNPIVYSCIQEICNNCKSIPIILYNKKKKKISDHEEIINLIRYPNKNQSYSSFMEEIISHRLIFGNTYLEINENCFGKKELYTLNPERIKIIPGPYRIPLQYEYNIDNKRLIFKINQITKETNIFHWKTFNPNNEWYGISPLKVSETHINIYNEGASWNENLLKHSCRPSGALMTDRDLNDEQYSRLREQLNENFSGKKNPGKVFIFEGGLKWKEMCINPKDMDFLKNMENSARMIALSLGIPPLLIGLPGDTTYNNFKEARISLWEKTIIPIMRDFCSSLTNWLLPKFGLDKNIFFLIPNLEKVNVFSDRKNNKFEKIILCVEKGIISIDEARVELGYTNKK